MYYIAYFRFHIFQQVFKYNVSITDFNQKGIHIAINTEQKKVNKKYKYTRNKHQVIDLF